MESRKIIPSSLRILALDPAIHNYGYSCIEIREDLSTWRIWDCGTLESTIFKLDTELTKLSLPHLNNLRELISLFRPHKGIIERYQTRGMFQMSMNECNNIQIGMFVAEARRINCSVNCYTPVLWKNRFQAIIQLNILYNSCKKMIRQYGKHVGWDKVITEFTNKAGKKLSVLEVLLNKVPHSIDATCMGLMMGATELGFGHNKWNNADLIVKKVAEALIRGVGKWQNISVQ